MGEPKPHILGVGPGELARWLREGSEPDYRIDQLLRWLYERRAASFDEMTNLPAALRERLAESYDLSLPMEVDRARSRDGRTEKFVFGLDDGARIESVWMGGRPRDAFCISSQAGCALGCAFCATGQMGFGRDLAVEEILGQVMALARAHEWPANVVFMGMGEPLLNLEAVLPALESLADERRFALGARRITVSTAGVPPGIRRLASHPVRPNLALSLNSPFPEQRRELMPITRTYPLAEVLAACKDYSERTGRRPLIEYVLLRAVNTSARAARATARIARELGALVNLIALNPVPGCPFRPPTGEEIERFRGILEGEGVPVTQRYRRGRDIAAGCGQLGGGG